MDWSWCVRYYEYSVGEQVGCMSANGIAYECTGAGIYKKRSQSIAGYFCHRRGSKFGTEFPLHSIPSFCSGRLVISVATLIVVVVLLVRRLSLCVCEAFAGVRRGPARV